MKCLIWAKYVYLLYFYARATIKRFCVSTHRSFAAEELFERNCLSKIPKANVTERFSFIIIFLSVNTHEEAFCATDTQPENIFLSNKPNLQFHILLKTVPWIADINFYYLLNRVSTRKSNWKSFSNMIGSVSYVAQCAFWILIFQVEGRWKLNDFWSNFPEFSFRKFSSFFVDV